MSSLFSHPDQALSTHVQGVTEAALQLLEGRSFASWPPERLRLFVLLAAVCHDFAKATSFFQEYIRSPQPRKTKLSSHTRLSALVGYSIAGLLWPDASEEERLQRLFLFLAIRRHHGNLAAPYDDINSFLEARWEMTLEKQIDAIDYPSWNALFSSFLPLFSPAHRDILAQKVLPFQPSLLLRWLQSWEGEKKQARKLLRKESIYTSLQGYGQLFSLYSLLLAADKHQAALRLSSLLPRPALPSDLVVQARQHRPLPSGSPLNALRQKAFEEAEASILAAPSAQRIFALTLPTGLGKTQTALHAALLLRQRRLEETGLAPRILYALPFLSIIDQNYDVFSRLLQDAGLPPSHALLLKHHSLTPPLYRVSQKGFRRDDLPSEAEKAEESEDFVFDEDQAQLLLEGWEAEITVTTFVQIFESLVSHKNRSLRRFHRFSHAILLLDEPQALRVHLWPLVRAILSFLASSMQTDILLITATQPYLFPSQEILQLCEPGRYFEGLDRVRLVNHLPTDASQRQTISSWLPSLSLDDQRSHLLIFNTIRAAQDALRLGLERSLVDREDVAYLSTHLIPKERLRRIREIQEGRYRVVFSTQLVEAGVDIDFDVVYRDLAPLDAIGQSAGRCNRHGLRQGELHLVELFREASSRNSPSLGLEEEPPSGPPLQGSSGTAPRRTFASLIYDSIALDETKRLLSSHKEISEADFLLLIQAYFQGLDRRSSDAEAKAILESAFSLRFTSDEAAQMPLSSFRLIEAEQPKVDIFVEADEEAVLLWQAFQEILQERDPVQRHKAFLSIKAAFHQYVIAVPASAPSLPPILGSFGYIGIDELSRYYDPLTGFRLEGSEIALW